MQTYSIMILPDGETYSDVTGCEILVVNEEGAQVLDDGGDPNDIPQDCIIHSVKFEAHDE